VAGVGTQVADYRSDAIRARVAGDQPGLAAGERLHPPRLDLLVGQRRVPDAHLVDLAAEVRPAAEIGPFGGSEGVVDRAGPSPRAGGTARRGHSVQQPVQLAGGRVVSQGHVVPFVEACGAQAHVAQVPHPYPDLAPGHDLDVAVMMPAVQDRAAQLGHDHAGSGCVEPQLQSHRCRRQQVAKIGRNEVVVRAVQHNGQAALAVGDERIGEVDVEGGEEVPAHAVLVLIERMAGRVANASVQARIQGELVEALAQRGGQVQADLGRAGRVDGSNGDLGVIAPADAPVGAEVQQGVAGGVPRSGGIERRGEVHGQAVDIAVIGVVGRQGGRHPGPDRKVNRDRAVLSSVAPRSPGGTNVRAGQEVGLGRLDSHPPAAPASGVGRVRPAAIGRHAAQPAQRVHRQPDRAARAAAAFGAEAVLSVGGDLPVELEMPAHRHSDRAAPVAAEVVAVVAAAARAEIQRRVG